MKTTLFIPVLNEIDGLRYIMPKIKNEWVDEIIFVDGGSTDGTLEFLNAGGYRVVKQKSKGVCGAYWECFEVATGDVIIPFSPDNNSLPESIPLLIDKMKEGYDMVIASRYLEGAKSFDDDRVTALGNWLFTKMVNILFGAKYTDVLVMLRAFRKDLIRTLQPDMKKYPILEMQLAIRCAKRKLKVTEIPVDEPKRIGGVRKMRPLYNGLTLLFMTIREIFYWR